MLKKKKKKKMTWHDMIKIDLSISSFYLFYVKYKYIY